LVLSFPSKGHNKVLSAVLEKLREKQKTKTEETAKGSLQTTFAVIKRGNPAHSPLLKGATSSKVYSIRWNSRFLREEGQS